LILGELYAINQLKNSIKVENVIFFDKALNKKIQRSRIYSPLTKEMTLKEINEVIEFKAKHVIKSNPSLIEQLSSTSNKEVALGIAQSAVHSTFLNKDENVTQWLVSKFVNV
jgi:hypothetical protein